MSLFKKYPKIHRLGKEETDGILEGNCDVQEKIDGANTQIWLEDGIVQCGSRGKHIEEGGFNGFVEYAQGHVGIQKLLTEHPDWRLYGEWLVRHTVQYKETAYKKFYLFDITTINEDPEETEEYFDIMKVNAIAAEYDMCHPYYFGRYEGPTVEQLKELVGQSTIGENGEGIVIKNPDFKDKWGNNHRAKIVTEIFKEDNAVTFGGNNKFSDTYWEVYVVNKYLTLARVQKIMHKLQPEIDKRLDMEHIPRVCSTVYHDMITEEAWEIAQKVGKLDYKALKRVSFKKAKQIYVDILNDSISIADK